MSGQGIELPDTLKLESVLEGSAENLIACFFGATAQEATDLATEFCKRQNR